METSAADTRSRLATRVMDMSVTLVVTLAEKRVELGQILAISPGTLISFEKSCDAPLVMSVNSRAFCTGEAIKIGENFGLKINEVL